MVSKLLVFMYLLRAVLYVGKHYLASICFDVYARLFNYTS